MKSFLCEYWLWIVGPFLVVAAVVIALLATTSDEVSPFVYPF
jgi:hypothetical protein